MSIVLITFLMLLVVPIVWGGRNLLAYRGTEVGTHSATYRTFLNSAVLYALAFNIIFFIQELFLVLGKKGVGLTSTLYHNNHTWQGSHPLVGLMQGSGALAIFLTGAVCLLIYLFIRRSQSLWVPFVLWLAFHGILQSLPQVTVAYMDPNTDVGEALAGYFALPEYLLAIIAITCVVLAATVSLTIGRFMLELAPHRSDIATPRSRMRYAGSVAVGAGLLGSLLVLPFRIFPVGQIVSPIIIFLFFVPWLWVASPIHSDVKATSNRINENVYWPPILALLLLLAFFQIVLAPGLTF